MNRRPLIALLREKREDILRIAAEHGAYNVRVFGSVARGEEDENSDVDLLVEMEKGRTLLDRASLYLALTDLLGTHVDVITEKGLKPRIKPRVVREAIPL